MNRRSFLQSVAGPLAVAGLQPASARQGWRAGAAKVDITPERSLWMAGFALRKEASQGTALPLHAKALALQAAGGRPAVLVTADLLGLTARITGRVAEEAWRRYRLERANLLCNASHTHCGPVIDDQLSVAYDLSAEQWTAIREYSAQLEGRLVALVGDALGQLRPARVSYARGEVGFARNRRVSFTPEGPVDHSVPVLRVDDAGGMPIGIVFGYACHNTTLQAGFVQYHGDYAGVAQALLERRHPGVTALFVTGCGADANPNPRGTVELVQAHGAALADAVDRVLPSAVSFPAVLRTSYGVVDLPFATGGARERWKNQLDIDPLYLKRYAAMMAATIARDGRLPAAQPAPVQVWRLGAGLALIGLSGEVVVDYALRIAREHPELQTWVAGYSNDVFGYVPSARVLREGGYEGGDAMVYYGRPAPFTGAVEDLLIREVRRQMRAGRG